MLLLLREGVLLLNERQGDVVWGGVRLLENREVRSGAGPGSHCRNLLFPRMRRFRYFRINKPRDMKMDGDVMRMQSNSRHRLTAVTTVLTLMEGLRTV